MKDKKWTELMLKSLSQDPSLASFEDWEKAGDYAAGIRFYPHAFNCYKNAFTLDKTEEIAAKLNVVLDKITNVLEHVPEKLKPLVEEMRLNNPLDPAKWLQVANQLLKEATEDNDFRAAKLALAFTSYAILRSGGEVDEINEILEKLNTPVKIPAELKTLELQAPEDGPFRAVAFGDNVTLGMQKDWEVDLRETYHFIWAKELGEHITLANCGVSGAGMMDALLYLGRDVVNYTPNLVFLNFGTNDTWLSKRVIPAYEALLDSVIDILRPHCEVVIITPIPHIPENCPDHLRPNKIDNKDLQIDDWVLAAKRSAARNDIVLVDAFAEFPEAAAERKKYFANGFNQLNLAGQKLIVKAINKVISFASLRA